MWIITLLPTSLWLLVIVGLALGFVLRLVSGKAIVGVIGMMAVTAVLGPFIESFMMALPVWVRLLLLIGLIFVAVKFLATLFLGREAAGHLTALIVHDLLLLPFRALAFLVRRR